MLWGPRWVTVSEKPSWSPHLKQGATCYYLIDHWSLHCLYNNIHSHIYFSALALLLLEHKFQKGRHLVFYLKGIPSAWEPTLTLSPSFCCSMNIYIHMKKQDKNIKVLWKVKWASEWVKSLSRVRFFATPWTVAHQAPLSMGFSRQEYWSGVPLRLSAKLKYSRHGLKVFPALLSQETLYSHTLFIRNCFMEKSEDQLFVKLWKF